jgi:hypothetical protein
MQHIQGKAAYRVFGGETCEKETTLKIQAQMGG